MAAYDVGVLVVHGIGTQSEGATLREFVDPLTEFLAALPGDGPEFLPSPEEGLLGLRTPDLDGSSQQWLVGEAWWADAFDVPDRVAVCKWLFDVGTWFVLFFVARLWRRFAAGPLEVALGVFGAVALGRLVAVAAAGNASGVDWLLAVAGLLAAATGLLRRQGRKAAAAVVLVSVLVLYPLAAVATVAMLLLSIVGSLPGKWTERVRALQISLSRSVGDCYSLISSKRRERAMFDAIAGGAEDLTKVLDDGGAPRPLVILAHSQGAALMFRILRSNDPAMAAVLAGRQVTLVTHGGAVLPIHVLEQRGVMGKWVAGWRGFAGLFGLLLMAFSLGRVVSGQVDVVAQISAGVSAALTAITFSFVRREELHSACHDPLQRPDTTDSSGSAADSGDRGLVGPAVGGAVRAEKFERGIGDGGPAPVCPALPVPPGGELRWVDLWAPWDPVPNGPLDLRLPFYGPKPEDPLPSTAGSGFLPCRVSNDHQPWKDHVNYRTNNEDVMLRWVGEIALRAKGTPPEFLEPPPTARVRRRRTFVGVQVLSLQALLLAFGLGALVAQWELLDDLGRYVDRGIPGPLRSAAAAVAGAVPAATRDALLGDTHDPARWQGFVVAGLGVLAAVAVFTAAGSFWRRVNSTNLLRPGRSARFMVGGVLTYVVAALVASAAVLVGVHGFHDGTARDLVVSVHVDAGGVPEKAWPGTVTFQPLAAGADDALVFEVPASGRTVHIDPARSYLVTAEADGAQECTAIVSPAPSAAPQHLELHCEAVGTVVGPTS